MNQCIFPGKIVMPLIKEENKTPARQGSSIGNDLSIAAMTRAGPMIQPACGCRRSHGILQTTVDVKPLGMKPAGTR